MSADVEDLFLDFLELVLHLDDDALKVGVVGLAAEAARDYRARQRRAAR